MPTHDELVRFCATGTTHDIYGTSGDYGESADPSELAGLPDVWLLGFQEVVELKAYNIMMKNNRASVAACEALEGSVKNALDALLAAEWEENRVARAEATTAEISAKHGAQSRVGGMRLGQPIRASRDKIEVMDGVVLIAMERLVGLVSFVFARRSTALGARKEATVDPTHMLARWPALWGVQTCVIPLGKKGLGNKGESITHKNSNDDHYYSPSSYD